jgi:hypothetical protein
MIEWRKTAGGVEIAEFGDITAVAYPSGKITVTKCGETGNSLSFYTATDAKKWFEDNFAKPKPATTKHDTYTVTKYPDGGEVYVSEDGQRVAMVSCTNKLWYVNTGAGAWVQLAGVEFCRVEAIDYVSKETTR